MLLYKYLTLLVVILGYIIDSGASDHMTFDSSLFTHLSNPPISFVINANGESFPILGTDLIYVTPFITLNNVLYVHALFHHLI